MRDYRPTKEACDAEAAVAAAAYHKERIRRVAEMVLPMQLAQYAAEDAAERSMLAARAIVAKWEEMEKGG